MSNTKLLPAKATRFSERKSKEELAKRKAEEELLALNPKKQMLRRNQEGKKEFEKKLLKDKANPFEIHSRNNTKITAKPIENEIPAKAKETIPKSTKMPKIDLSHKPIPMPKKKKLEELSTKKKKKFEEDDEIEYSDSYSDEAFEISFGKKEKAPTQYPQFKEVPKALFNNSVFSVQAVPSQKIITNEAPVLIKSSNQMTVELLHAVQLIFNDREEAAVRIIEIPNPEVNPYQNMTF